METKHLVDRGTAAAHPCQQMDVPGVVPHQDVHCFSSLPPVFLARAYQLPCHGSSGTAPEVAPQHAEWPLLVRNVPVVLATTSQLPGHPITTGPTSGDIKDSAGVRRFPVDRCAHPQYDLLSAGRVAERISPFNLNANAKAAETRQYDAAIGKSTNPRDMRGG
jgi:hypothetical protein